MQQKYIDRTYIFSTDYGRAGLNWQKLIRFLSPFNKRLEMEKIVVA